ncbi:MAG: DUF364 domain-containing protein [Deltaproteobacteria bacterium]
MDPYAVLRQRFLEIIERHSWEHEPIEVSVRTLSPEEAIGNPEHDDYPLVRGRERMMEAVFKGSRGQAFTDMYGLYSGTLIDTATMELKNNYRRTVFLSTLNAVMRHLGMIERSVHCKDDAPPKCAVELVSYIRNTFGSPKIAMIGLQPRMVQALAAEFDIRVTDMDEDNIGRERFGISIGDPDQTMENLAWCDVALVTGTVFTNATVWEFLKNRRSVFYGVTVAGPAEILGVTRFCPLGL